MKLCRNSLLAPPSKFSTKHLKNHHFTSYNAQKSNIDLRSLSSFSRRNKTSSITEAGGSLLSLNNANNKKKEKLIILGCGWAGLRILK